MSRKKVRLSYKKERCLLSDVLPYEIPISFSNRHFYWFILRNRVTVEGERHLLAQGFTSLGQNCVLAICAS